ncbi:MAG: putative lipid II flippase FtsW [Patescibacteria group bacterium]
MKQKRRKKRSLFAPLQKWIVKFISKEKHTHPDYVLLGMTFLLLLLGLMILTSASSVVALRQFDDSYFFLKQQLMQGVFLGVVGAIVLYNISIEWLQKWSFHIFLFSLVLLILVLIPQFGDTRLGASRWLNLGPLSFQPSEVVKFTFVLYLAAWLTKQKDYIKDFKTTFIPFVIVLCVVGGLLILQPDMGTMGIFVLIALTMYFVAGGHLGHLALLGVGGMTAVWLLIKAAPYRAARLTTFLNPELDPQGLGYHINQALLAIGSGGFFGKGLGHSRQKFQYLPEVYGDSIFAVMAEELGFLFTLIIVGLFVYYFIRGFQVAGKVPHTYASLLAIGIVAWLGWQTIVNIGAMVGLLPLTGVPWPLVSYGSTALAINLSSIGLVLSISRQMKQ